MLPGRAFAWWMTGGDVWAFPIDGDGGLIWEKANDIPFSDLDWCAIPTADGYYLMTGSPGYRFGGNFGLVNSGNEPTTFL
ncbi:hypothetical protein JXJ21_02695 [candidate division KSB1 bacterium]|nr:hypothetical protein [candidate division KSB1 bacterium]